MHVTIFFECAGVVRKSKLRQVRLYTLSLNIHRAFSCKALSSLLNIMGAPAKKYRGAYVPAFFCNLARASISYIFTLAFEHYVEARETFQTSSFRLLSDFFLQTRSFSDFFFFFFFFFTRKQGETMNDWSRKMGFGLAISLS